MHGVAVDFYCK